MPGRLDDDLGRFIERVVLPAGWRVLHEPTVESTNDLAREASELTQELSAFLMKVRAA